MRRSKTSALAGAGTVAAIAVSGAIALAAPAGTTRGPSTPTDPYVLPIADGVATKSLLTVGDAGAAGDGYEMVGIPDGLGAYQDPGSRDVTLLMNHELRLDQGVVRRHGQNGAFVAELEIDTDTFGIEEGKDFIDSDIRYWNYVRRRYQATPSPGGINPRDTTDTFPAQTADFQRFCSGYLTTPGQLLDEATGRGFKGQIYFANEESGDEGRVFGITLDGQAQQLPRLGLFSWENTIAAQNETRRTLVMGNEDTATGQVWAYMGKKKRNGSAFDKAGLTNGENFVVDLEDESVDSDAEYRATYGKGTPVPFDLGEAEKVNWDRSGARQNADAATKGITLNRIEDGSFDPQNPNDYYFLTTEGSPGVVPDEPALTRDGGGLWKLSFTDVEHPELGGTLELILDGTEDPFLNKPDNMTIDTRGNLLIQEDPGNNAQLARIIAYRISNGDRGVLAEFDEAKFRSGQTGFITQDEESSGIIDAKEFIGPGWFIFDAQAHAPSGDPATVEPGQLLTMNVRRWRDVYTIDGDE